MRCIIDEIEARDLPEAVQRLGISEDQRIRVVIDVLGDAAPATQIAEQSGGFAFLADEPDSYSPNLETIEAMNAARKGDLRTIGGIDDLLSDLNKDD
ncbi:MAG TPA: hypothetical protein VG889_03750 [Rhizomicrobium sp.]|nr:hypothetical protein [Rhizomicrobium sp.]